MIVTHMQISHSSRWIGASRLAVVAIACSAALQAQTPAQAEDPELILIRIEGRIDDQLEVRCYFL